MVACYALISENKPRQRRKVNQTVKRMMNKTVMGSSDKWKHGYT